MAKAMKIAFSGCRDATIRWHIADRVRKELGVDNEEHEALVGDCKTGIDLFIREYCKQANISCTVFVADWDKHGKAAGPIRNTEMVKEADVLVAFWDGKSKGTLSAITAATKKHIPVKIYPL